MYVYNVRWKRENSIFVAVSGCHLWGKVVWLGHWWTMDQDAVFDIGSFDEGKVSLDEPPRDGMHYLQQVALSRARCPKVVTAQLNRPSRGVSSSGLGECSFTCGSPSLWSVYKSSGFAIQRSTIEWKKSRLKNCLKIRLPKHSNEAGWRKFCLEERSPEIQIDEKDQVMFAHHLGNPPTMRLVLNLSEKVINSLITHLVDFFINDGYSRALFEWIYAVLLVLQKPLLHDVCCALRDLAKHARLLRDTLNKDEQSLNNSPSYNEFSVFIAIVGVYFEQKDLADV